MSFNLTRGKTFTNVSHKTVIDYLEHLDTDLINLNAGSLQIVSDSNNDLLLKNGAQTFKIRESFLKKLLKWKKIPYSIVDFMDDATILNICNDILISIGRSPYPINLKLEEGDAASIFSNNYTLISDLEILKFCEKFIEIDEINRNDYVMVAKTRIQTQATPIPGDNYGFGFALINSETGFGYLNFELYALRYICTNGAYVRSNFDFKHPHYNIEKKTILEDFQNILINAKQAKSNKFLENLVLSQKIMAAKHLNSAKQQIEYIVGQKKSFYFFSSFYKKNGIEQNLYDLFNYITDQAKQYEIHERYFLEQYAGSLINNLHKVEN